MSGAPDFFRRAFGASVDEFEALLLRPEKYLFNRVWYEELGGRAEFEEFRSEFRMLNHDERSELAALLSSSIPSRFKDLHVMASARLHSILKWYTPLSDAEEIDIWRKVSQSSSRTKRQSVQLPDDERVEDAGLMETA